jgi:hypothetical protein
MFKVNPSFATMAVGFAVLLPLSVGNVASGAVDLPKAREAATSNAPTRTAKVAPRPTRAYALVIPGCSGCGKRRPGSSPLISAQSMNVDLGSVHSGAPIGTWCFLVTKRIDLAASTVVVNAVNTGGPYTNHFPLESAQWILDGPDCMPHQIEIQTFGYLIEGGRMVAVPDRETAFSFSVDSR